MTEAPVLVTVVLAKTAKVDTVARLMDCWDKHVVRVLGLVVGASLGACDVVIGGWVGALLGVDI
jgi:hypothetical protein